jgi:uncharacterized protein (DUF433 family)
LIVEKKTHRPASGFRRAHGHENDPAWEEWWTSEAERAIRYDWKLYLPEPHRFQPGAPEDQAARVREDEKTLPDFHGIIMSEPPPAHIRESKITVGKILAWLAQGRTEEEILKEHHQLRTSDIRASLAWASERVEVTAKPTFAERWRGRFTLPPPDLADERLTYLLERYEGADR